MDLQKQIKVKVKTKKEIQEVFLKYNTPFPGSNIDSCLFGITPLMRTYFNKIITGELYNYKNKLLFIDDEGYFWNLEYLTKSSQKQIHLINKLNQI
jgi:hypothetical protein